MKTRIILSVLFLVLAGWFSRSIGEPVSVVAQNHASVATLNGGDDAFVVQHSVDYTVQRDWRFLITSLGLVVIWAAPLKRFYVSRKAGQVKQ